MVETWLKPNRRAMLPGLIIASFQVPVGVLLAAGVAPWLGPYVSMLGFPLAGIGALLVPLLAWQIRRPMVGYQRGHVLFYLRLPPIRVPIDVVECFLLGHDTARCRGFKTATVVVRLSEKATEWAHVHVRPSLGRWCDGYITISGMWCEPLDVEVVQRLNRQLAAATKVKELA